MTADRQTYRSLTGLMARTLRGEEKRKVEEEKRRVEEERLPTSSKIDLNNKALLLNQTKDRGQVREIARLNSLGLQNSHQGDWLTVVPNPGLGLLIQPSEFVVALRYRLGQPVFAADGPCPACGRHSDRLGDHALNCAWQGERIARHNSLRDVLHGAAVSAALAPTKEGKALLPGQGEKPADYFYPTLGWG